MPAPVLLWLALAGHAVGFRASMLFAAAVWLVGWVLLRRVYALSPTTALGLSAAWELVGVSLCLFAGLAPFPDRATQDPWLPKQVVFAALMVVAVAGALHLGAQQPKLRERLLGPRGVRAALWLSVSALLLQSAVALVPRLTTGAWALLQFAFVLGTAIVAGRTALAPSAPTNLRQWVRRWQWTLVMAALPVTVLFVLRDLSPAVLLTCVQVVTFWSLGQVGVGVALLASMAAATGVAFKLGVPTRLVERLRLVLLPSQGRTSQQLQALWAVAGGGPFGRGVGRFCVVSKIAGGRSARSAAAMSGQFRSAIPLAATDGIWALLTESVGVFGALAVVVLVGLVSYWLWQEHRRAADSRRKAWFAAAFAAWSFSHAFTLGWCGGNWPVMGLAAPLLSAGLFNALLWIGVLGTSAVLSLGSSPSLVGSQPTRRFSTAAWLPPTFVAAVTILVLSRLIRHGVLEREETLRTPFVYRAAEALCRRAVLLGQVVACNGQPIVNAEALPTDREQRKSTRESLKDWIDLGAFRVAENGKVEVDGFAFVVPEPTGLGTVLRLSEGAWTR
jgi:cell division protein FtsW (lipid II flippase)